MHCRWKCSEGDSSVGDGEVGVSSLCMLCKEKYLVNLLVVIHQQRRQFDSLCIRDTNTAHQSPNPIPHESIPTTYLQHWVPTYKVFPPRFPRQPQPSMFFLEVSQTLPSFKLSESLRYIEKPLYHVAMSIMNNDWPGSALAPNPSHVLLPHLRQHRSQKSTCNPVIANIHLRSRGSM